MSKNRDILESPDQRNNHQGHQQRRHAIRASKTLDQTASHHPSRML
jgi:hypothetical protein